jgi:hypothetical protein
MKKMPRMSHDAFNNTFLPVKSFSVTLSPAIKHHPDTEGSNNEYKHITPQKKLQTLQFVVKVCLRQYFGMQRIFSSLACWTTGQM